MGGDWQWGDYAASTDLRGSAGASAAPLERLVDTSAQPRRWTALEATSHAADANNGRLAIKPLESHMQSPNSNSPFLMKLTFELLEQLIESWVCSDGLESLACDPWKIRLLRRIPELIEGLPSKPVQDIYRHVFLQDLWEELPPIERQPGMMRRFTADHRRLATLDD